MTGLKKKKTLPYVAYNRHFRTKDRDRLKVRGWKKIFHANRNNKKAREAVFTPEKIDFKTNSIIKGKEGHYIMIKG